MSTTGSKEGLVYVGKRDLNSEGARSLCVLLESVMKHLAGIVKELGGFSVKRILPHPDKRMVGPFIFFDHLRPAEFGPGEGLDVRPHPHVGLATISYLFEGAMLHRDSLGNVLEILPGDVNVMFAGRGIVHSERESFEVKARAHRVSGIQSWIALPREHDQMAPDFKHVHRNSLPCYMKEGLMMRLIMGEALGMRSPVPILSPMFYFDVIAQAGCAIPRPNPDHECMVFVVDGSVSLNGEALSVGDAVLLASDAVLHAEAYARCLLLGGEAWTEVPKIEWNFVAFDEARLEQAKTDWAEGRFPRIPGDDEEHIVQP